MIPGGAYLGVEQQRSEKNIEDAGRQIWGAETHFSNQKLAYLDPFLKARVKMSTEEPM